jgi:hypothetical protein
MWILAHGKLVQLSEMPNNMGQINNDPILKSALLEHTLFLIRIWEVQIQFLLPTWNP